MTSSSERQPLLSTNRHPWLPPAVCSVVGAIGLTGFTLNSIDIFYPSIGLPTRLFNALGCLCTICLSAYVIFKPRQVAPVNATFSEETTKTADLGKASLVKLDQKLDTLIKKMGILAEIPLNSPREEGLDEKIDRTLAAIEAKLEAPDKEFIMAILRKAQNSRPNSKGNTPVKSQTPSPSLDVDGLLSELEGWLDDNPPPLNLNSPTKLSQSPKDHW